jgi:hypothetical protein
MFERSMAQVDPLRSLRQRQLRGSLFSSSVSPPPRARLKLLPIWRVLEGLLGMTLLHEHITPMFVRIGPMRSALICILELGLGAA